MLNHWWQTETGHSITAHCLGYQHDTVPPKYSTGLPFPGYDGKRCNLPFTLICLGSLVLNFIGQTLKNNNLF